MYFTSFEFSQDNVRLSVSKFEGASGDEYHIIGSPGQYGNFAQQLDSLVAAYKSVLETIGLDNSTIVLKRFFCSDVVNQAPLLEMKISGQSGLYYNCGISVIGQCPAGGAKIALWAYHVKTKDATEIKKSIRNSIIFAHNKRSHCWTTGMACDSKESSYEQTTSILESYEAFLHSQKMSFEQNVVRTWFYIQNVDANYMGFVAARKEFFASRGLTCDTHFIASTGIDGLNQNPAVKITMDAHAISNLQPGQIEYLCVPENMSPTHVYGVTFERGTTISYSDRKHIIISGTASIDNRGKIMHQGDIYKQIDRTVENIEALLSKGGASKQNLAMTIVYVRDASDAGFAGGMVKQMLGNVPMQVVTAPVCRPGWLVEIEAKAILQIDETLYPAF